MLFVLLMMVGVAGLMMAFFSEKKAVAFSLMVVGFGGMSLVWKLVEAAAIKAGEKYAFVDFIRDLVHGLVALA